VRCPVRPPLFIQSAATVPFERPARPYFRSRRASDQRLMAKIFAAHSFAAAFCPCGHAHGRCV